MGINTPALSPDGSTICFSYQGDLWTVPSAGGAATRLTVHDAHDAYPRYSPDGKWIAFASNRYPTAELNYDIWVIPSSGGTARQITRHTVNDYPNDWSPDGTRILFHTRRDGQTWQAASVDVKTLAVKIHTADTLQIRYPVYAPDGKSIAYNRGGGVAVWWRPRFRSSAAVHLYTRSLETNRVTRIGDGDTTELWPMYSADGKRLYCAAEKLTPGAANIVAFPIDGGRPVRITNHKTDSVRWPSISKDGRKIVYVFGGELWTVETAGGEPKRVPVIIRTDEKRNHITRIEMTSGATDAEVSPDGRTLAFVARGEIWTIPADRGGDAKRLTNRAANDHDIVWSPDSKTLAFVSDKNGQFDIFTIDINTREEKPIAAEPVDESSPKYSPDGRYIAFLRSGAAGGLYVVPIDGSVKPVRVAESQGNNLFGVGISAYSWSPDSRWLAFARRDDAETVDIWITPADASKAPVNVTSWPGTNTVPVWTGDGRHLVFISDRGVGERLNLYDLPLKKPKQELESPPSAPPGAPPTDVSVEIDWEEITDRARRITVGNVEPFVGSGRGSAAIALEASPDGRSVVFASGTGGRDYWLVPVTGGQATRLTSTGDVLGPVRFGKDPNRFWHLTAGLTIRSVTRLGPTWQSSPVNFSARMEVDTRAENEQAFNEFWRRMNTGFYDPKMHGVDWVAVRERYRRYLEGVGTPEEFALFLLAPMVGELNASHTETNPPTSPVNPSTAQLGIHFDQDYAGPGLKVTGYVPKGPNDDVTPIVKPGEYVVAIEGTDVSWNEYMYDTLAGKAGKVIELLVNTKPGREGARTVKIRPITTTQLADLLYEQRVRTAREAVAKLSNGRLGYAHIRGMNPESTDRFERELWGDLRRKDGLVLDIRGNNGGNTHDELLSQLHRASYGFTQPRDSLRSTQPFKHFHKPIILLIDQDSVSDGEIFPAGFRTLKLGKILGTPTPGYVIGTYSGTLINGVGYRIPMWGWFYADGRNMENNGVQPDIFVENTPEDIENRRDPQLEKAVQLLLKETGSK
jgi:Tol biopolymer transport system component/C-terminal processing protease CtpA/Prc